MSGITLGGLIAWLEKQDPAAIVEGGFSTPHSDRGYYYNLAFKPAPEARIGDMLEHAKGAVGATFDGWKGGEYRMGPDTDVFIGDWGSCGEPITSAQLRLWELTAREPEEAP